MTKKLLLIAILGTILTFIIYSYTKNDNLTIVSIGDGLSLGMTPYNIKGISYNDYLKEDYKLNHKLKAYYEFGLPNITLKELIYSLKENTSQIFKNEPIRIKRAIYEADILTLAIGMDELSNLKITNQIRLEFKNDFQELINIIKSLNPKKVIVLSLYNKNIQDALTINKLNAIIRDITLSNNYTFIDINILIKNEYYLSPNSYYLNYKGHKTIYKEIKKYL